MEKVEELDEVGIDGDERKSMSSIERHEWSINCDFCKRELGFWDDEMDVVIDRAAKKGWQVATDNNASEDICKKCLKEKE